MSMSSWFTFLSEVASGSREGSKVWMFSCGIGTLDKRTWVQAW